MRRFLTFSSGANDLQATLDDAAGATGLILVSGGNEPRFGPRGVLTRLAADLAEQGIPCFRYDRSGIGDSSGENTGFEGALPDLLAAVQAFRAARPDLAHIAAYGNCDGATQILRAPFGLFSHLILSNIWLGDVPQTPASLDISAALHESKPRQASTKLKLFFYKLWKKIFHIILEDTSPPPLAGEVSERMSKLAVPVHIILAQGDRTARLFSACWASRQFRRARANPHISRSVLKTDSHSFALPEDYSLLRTAIMDALRR